MAVNGDEVDVVHEEVNVAKSLMMWEEVRAMNNLYFNYTSTQFSTTLFTDSQTLVRSQKKIYRA